MRHYYNLTITPFKRTSSQCHMLYRGVKTFNSVPETQYMDKTLKIFSKRLC